MISRRPTGLRRAFTGWGILPVRHDNDATGQFYWPKLLGTGADTMQDRRDEPPVVRCPGCHHPMQPKERTSATERLVDIRYVCATCGMETKRTVAEESLKPTG